MPTIQSYRFGCIRIDGLEYRKDVLILRDRIVSPWFRTAGGHVFAPADLVLLIEGGPETVVLGTGYWGRVKVPDETVAAFTAGGSKVVIEPSRAAVERFNELATEGRDVAAALHLTC